MSPITNLSSELRLQNARSVLLASLHRWPCTKPELADRTGLTQMTVGKVVDQLLDAGCFARVSEPNAVSHGRPPLRVAPSPDADLVGIELGLRHTSVYRFGLGCVAEPRQRRTLAAHESLAALRADLQRYHAECGPEPPRAVMIAVPGVLDEETSAILYSANLHWTEGEQLLAALAADFQAPVHPVHEAQALALGHLHSEPGSDHFLLVELGDGVGSAVVADRQLLGGQSPLCGEIGHTAVPGNPRRCGCGATGCIETMAGRGGLLRSFREWSGRHGADWEDMRTALRDTNLPRWLMETLDSLSMVVAGAVNLLGCSRLVFVGDLTELHPQVMPCLVDGVSRHSLLGRFGRVECQAAPVRRQLGLLAAAIERVYLAKSNGSSTTSSA